MPVNFSGHDLTCVRGGRTVFTALSFRVGQGGALLLRGPNGSGKSSLLRLIAGFQVPAAGGFRWDDQPIAPAADAHRARITHCSHLNAVKAAMTVTEHLRFWIDLSGSVDAAADTSSALERWGLAKIAELPGAYLSAGQRRRLNLARLSASRADLWLLDEPAVGLDDAAVQTLTEMIGEHRGRGGLAVIATHGGLSVAGAETLDLDRYTGGP